MSPLSKAPPPLAELPERPERNSYPPAIKDQAAAPTGVSVSLDPATRSSASLPIPLEAKGNMAIRDPYFWRRFSTAVHLDEIQRQNTSNTASKDLEKQTKQDMEPWLERQRKKTRRTWWCGFLILLSIAIVAAGIGVVIAWLKRNNWFLDRH